MKYVKLTPEDFEKKVRQGEYKNWTGARRALGKVTGEHWTEASIEAMRQLIVDVIPGRPKAVSKKWTRNRKYRSVAFQTQELTFDFLLMDHQNRKAVLSVLGKCRDIGISLGDAWQILHVADTKLRKK